MSNFFQLDNPEEDDFLTENNFRKIKIPNVYFLSKKPKNHSNSHQTLCFQAFHSLYICQ